MQAITKDLDKAKTDTVAAVEGSLAPTLVTIPFDLVESGVRTAFGAAQDVRGELKSLADTSYDYAEELSKTVFRTGRKITTRVEQISANTLGTGERLLLTGIASLRRISGNAVKLAGDTSAAIVGDETAAA